MRMVFNRVRTEGDSLLLISGLRYVAAAKRGYCGGPRDKCSAISQRCELIDSQQADPPHTLQQFKTRCVVATCLLHT